MTTDTTEAALLAALEGRGWLWDHEIQALIDYREARYAEVLDTYGWHVGNCGRRYGADRGCTCGFDAALAALKAGANEEVRE